MPQATVNVIGPLRNLLVAAFTAYEPLMTKVRPQNRRITDNEQPIKEFHDPAGAPNVSLKWVGGTGSTLHSGSPTFSTFHGGWAPGRTHGITQETYAFEVTLTTRELDSQEASELYEDAKSALLNVGPKIGAADVTAVNIGRVRVDDVTSKSKPGQAARQGMERKRVTFTVNVTIEAQTADLMPVAT